MGNQWIVKTEAHRANLIKFFEKVELPESGLCVEWFDADSKRTLEMNKLMWVGAYQPIALFLSEKTGNHYTKDMIHAVCKERFLEPILVPTKEGIKKYPGSTRGLSKQEFSDYLEKIWSWGAEMGVYFE